MSYTEAWLKPASYPEAEAIKQLVEKSKDIVILQADNPDGDSLGSALALEHILGDLGKEPALFCGVDIPGYLRYLEGWDRVSKDLPTRFDMSFIVDTGADSLFGSLESSGQRPWVAAKPCVVLDHHPTASTIPYATIVCSHPAVATGEIIYELAASLNWPINASAANLLATSILSDSLGLASEATTARSIMILAELVNKGASLSSLNAARRQLMRRSPELTRYKGELLQRVEFHADDRISTIDIPWEEISRYSHEYNPSVLVLDDMRLTTGVAVAIAFKTYPDGRITAKITCNPEGPVAQQLAEAFGGGGHAFASGFKVDDGRKFNEVKPAVIELAAKLLNDIPDAKAPN